MHSLVGGLCVAMYAAEYTSICTYVTIFSIVVIVVSGQNFHIKRLCEIFAIVPRTGMYVRTYVHEVIDILFALSL